VSKQPVDPEEQARLEQERDFLMQSLDDLELERESGGIDDESYAQLHDDYTARAAAVIRTLRDGVDTRLPHAAPKPLRRRLAVISVIVVLAVVAGASLAFTLGARLPGQTASGNTGAATTTTNAAGQALARTITSLEHQTNAKPDDYQLRLELARAYEENGDLANALKQSDAAITIDPNRPEGHANAGRLLYLASDPRIVTNKNERDQLVAEAVAALTKAITVGPDFADSYYFRSVLFAATSELPRAQTDLQQYLVLAPNGQWSDPARKLLAQVTTAIESPSTTVPPTTSKKTK